MAFDHSEFIPSVAQKHQRYYLYNTFYRPAELTFFGAFLSVYLSFLILDILNLNFPYNGNITLYKLFIVIIILLIGVLVFSAFILAFDYTLTKRQRTTIYSVSIIVLVLLEALLFYGLRLSDLLKDVPNKELIVVKIFWILPIIFMLWVMVREAVLRPLSRAIFSRRNDVIFRNNLCDTSDSTNDSNLINS